MAQELYRCERCSGHVFIVVHGCRMVTNNLKMLRCRCGRGPDGVAAHKTRIVVEEFAEWGRLDEEHGWAWEAKNLEEVEDRGEDYQVLCERCASRAEEDSDWEVLDEFTEDLDHEFYVFCGECEKEIEFGWSAPDRQGGIWPVEASDFDPACCLPEPRYYGLWVDRGWIQEEEE